MKILSLLPLTLLAVSSSAFAAGGRSDIPSPYPEAGLFAPITATPVAKSHPAWETIVSLDSKGLPLRAVLAVAFETAKLQYAVDPGLDMTIYVNVKDVSLRDAVGILGRLAEFDVRAEGGVWYASRRKPKAAKATAVAPLSGAIVARSVAGTPKSTVMVRTTVVATNAPGAIPVRRTAAKVVPRPAVRPSVTTVATQAIEVDTTPRPGAMVPMRVIPPASIVRTAFPVGTTAGDVPVGATRAAGRAPLARPSLGRPSLGRPSLGRRVSTKMPKTDLRTVFESFSQQTGVAIVVEESVPRYRIDAFMKGCSLKYALDKICAAAGLKYESVGSAVRITKG